MTARIDRGAARRLLLAAVLAALVTGWTADTTLAPLHNLASGLAYGLPTFAVVAGGLSAVAWAVGR